jgi:ESF2/ABP1 family protein
MLRLKYYCSSLPSVFCGEIFPMASASSIALAYSYPNSRLSIKTFSATLKPPSPLSTSPRTNTFTNMTTRKRNEWLEADLSNEENSGSDLDVADEGRGRAFSGSRLKRRKLNGTEKSDNEDDLQSDIGQRDVSDSGEVLQNRELETGEGKAFDRPASQQSSDSLNVQFRDSFDQKSKSSLTKKATKASDASARSGVVYVSRIPPFMKPHTLKHFLSPCAPSGLGRIFLTPESQDAHKSRVRAGGNKKRNFTDGWVEFVSKKEAKTAVETLNARIIGGKKGGYYYDDVWNLKYLKGFKWRHLTEQIANENAERTARMRAEDARERREAREYLKNVEKAKMLEGMEKKRSKKASLVEDVAGEQYGEDETKTQHAKDRGRQLKQIEVKIKSVGDKSGIETSDEVKRVLSKIF